MRLIDADKLDDELFDKYPMEENISLFSDLIREQPTAYDIEKVVQELEETKCLYKRIIKYENKNGTISERLQAEKAVGVLERAIKIVKRGGLNDD